MRAARHPRRANCSLSARQGLLNLQRTIETKSEARIYRARSNLGNVTRKLEMQINKRGSSLVQTVLDKPSLFFSPSTPTRPIYPSQKRSRSVGPQ
ncbi:hypothetical protein VTK56DRAFT_7118 [Thermocarpiscus australiensis]